MYFAHKSGREHLCNINISAFILTEAVQIQCLDIELCLLAGRISCSFGLSEVVDDLFILNTLGGYLHT
jgi:hypothetical protein